MKKTILLLTMCLLVMACRKDFPDCIKNGQEKELYVNTSLQTYETRSGELKNQFQEGDQLGLLILSENGNDPYRLQPDYINFYSTYQEGQWIIAPPVILNEEKGRVFAYYPFSASSVSQYKLSLMDKDQTDVLWGKPTNTDLIYAGQNIVNLGMEHSKTALAFKFRMIEDTGTLSTIRIEPDQPGISSYHSAASLDLLTGSVILLQGSDIGLTCAVDNLLIDENYSENIFLLVFPHSAQQFAGGIRVTIVVDGVNYKYVFPTDTVWDSGYVFTYYMTLDAGGDPSVLVLDNVIIEEWKSAEDSDEIIIYP